MMMIPTDEQVPGLLDKITNALAKWRNVYAAKMFGYWKFDPPYQDARKKAQYDEYAGLRELHMLMRAEINALTGLLIRKGLITQMELARSMLDETAMLIQDYERRFPGLRCNWDMVASIDDNTWEKTRAIHDLPPLPGEEV